MKAYIEQITVNWKWAWRNKRLRENFIGGIIALFVVVIFTYFFFDYIENRSGGVVMNDWILRIIPAKDVSIPIVFFELSVIILFSIRCLTNPTIVVTFLLGYVLVLITRNITIGITQLRAPHGCINLQDPIAALIYRSSCCNRDLFYSGHVSLLFFIYLCSVKKPDKHYILFAVCSVGGLLLIQHIHYTVDVVCAPFFAFACYWISKKITYFPPLPAMARCE